MLELARSDPRYIRIDGDVILVEYLNVMGCTAIERIHRGCVPQSEWPSEWVTLEEAETKELLDALQAALGS